MPSLLRPLPSPDVDDLRDGPAEPLEPRADLLRQQPQVTHREPLEDARLGG